MKPILEGGLYFLRLSDTHFYGGSTLSFKGRWREHLRTLKKGTHSNPIMQAVYDKHHRLDTEVLKACQDPAERLLLEQAWLDENYGTKGCVNICPIAESPMGGRIHTEESKAKMSKAKRGRILTEAHCKALSEAQKLRHSREGVSDETRKKISLKNRGMKRPDNAIRGLTQRGWNHTPETRAKISKNNSRSRAGKTHTPEAREKIKEARAKQVFSLDSLLKRGESMRKTWASRKAIKEEQPE